MKFILAYFLLASVFDSYRAPHVGLKPSPYWLLTLPPQQDGKVPGKVCWATLIKLQDGIEKSDIAITMAPCASHVTKVATYQGPEKKMVQVPIVEIYPHVEFLKDKKFWYLAVVKLQHAIEFPFDDQPPRLPGDSDYRDLNEKKYGYSFTSSDDPGDHPTPIELSVLGYHDDCPQEYRSESSGATVFCTKPTPDTKAIFPIGSPFVTGKVKSSSLILHGVAAADHTTNPKEEAVFARVSYYAHHQPDGIFKGLFKGLTTVHDNTYFLQNKINEVSDVLRSRKRKHDE